MALNVISLSVRSGAVAYVYLDQGQLRDWAISTTVSGSRSDLVAFVQTLINELQPDVVVSEKCDHRCRKGPKTRELIASIAALASHNYVLDVSVPRPAVSTNKHDEAKDMVSRHPELIGYVPKRKPRIYESEPRNLLIFEAVALAEAVTHGPPEQLAAAMG